ncbi:MAG: asparagine synthase (glutamine-hydrolyzing) [Sandaracinaceae bacterium]|nr:asparagine synthase (glutamine-hydrolyzing) [Sandaracinaceae bacterium]
MCGIAGIVTHTGEEALVRRMLRRLAHRGPDGERVLVRRVGERVATFGHRRLAIVDLEGGVQPIEDGGCGEKPEARAMLTFNGEIYNHTALRKELEKQGVHFKTKHSDAETLVAALASWGVEALPRFSGMFAFASMDLRTGEVLLARDRSGIKPLYWAPLPESVWPGGGIAFASELHALFEVPGLRPRIDWDGLASLLFIDCVPPPLSIVQGVFKLGPGECLRLLPDGRKEHERFVGRETPLREGRVDAGLLEAELGRAVCAQLMSDVPIALLLSGGIDSSLVASFAVEGLRREGRPDPVAFAIGFEEASFDELNYARKVAQHLGIELVGETLSQRALLDVLDQALDALDEPIGDHSILPTYLLSRLASRCVKVALGGDGADELFGGYVTYFAHQVAEGWVGHFLGWLEKRWGFDWLRHLLNRLPSSDAYQAIDWKLKRFFGRWDAEPIRRHLRWMSAIDLPELPMLLGEEAVEPWLGSFKPSHGPPVAQAMDLDAMLYLPGSVLTKVDRASMAHGLEVRPPFLDERVIAIARALPLSSKLRGRKGKVILREIAQRRLPRFVSKRKKHGFSIPLARWLRGPLRARVERILEDSPVWLVLPREPFLNWFSLHKERRGEHTKALWLLIVLDHWMRRHC